MEGTSYIALFGGYDCNADKAISNILIIDLDKYNCGADKAIRTESRFCPSHAFFPCVM
jgi:hypothetical protein